MSRDLGGMRSKSPALPKETPEEAARRQAEEARVAAAQDQADKRAISAAQRVATQRTRRVFRLFGANAAASFGGQNGGLALADFANSVTGGGSSGGVMLAPIDGTSGGRGGTREFGRIDPYV